MMFFRLVALLFLACLPACGQVGKIVLDGNPVMNDFAFFVVPPPPCSQTLATTMSHAGSSSDAVGITVYYAGMFLTTNLASQTPTCVSMVIATNGPTTCTYQWAIYNDAAVSGTPGTINGAFGPSYNATALSGSLTTNQYTISPTTPLSSSTVTNYIVIKITGSSGNNDLKIGNWNPTGTGWLTLSSANGTSWSTYNTQDAWPYIFYK